METFLLEPVQFQFPFQCSKFDITSFFKCLFGARFYHRSLAPAARNLIGRNHRERKATDQSEADAGFSQKFSESFEGVFSSPKNVDGKSRLLPVFILFIQEVILNKALLAQKMMILCACQKPYVLFNKLNWEKRSHTLSYTPLSQLNNQGSHTKMQR